MSPPGHAAAPGNAEGGAQIAGQEITRKSSRGVSRPPAKGLEYRVSWVSRPPAKGLEYRVSWRRTDRPLRRSRIFQFRASAEKSFRRNAWWHDDVRLEVRTVGKWSPVGMDEDVT